MKDHFKELGSGAADVLGEFLGVDGVCQGYEEFIGGASDFLVGVVDVGEVPVDDFFEVVF